MKMNQFCLKNIYHNNNKILQKIRKNKNLFNNILKRKK